MTDIWGPLYWNFFHELSLFYPNKPSTQDRAYGMTFIYNIDRVLPCPKCAIHYRQNFKIISTTKVLQSKTQFIKWFINLHNIVNKMLKKNQISITKSLTKITKNIENGDKNISLFNKFHTFLNFMHHSLPENSNASIGHIRAIKRFLKAVIYLAGFNRYGPFNLQFNNQQNFQTMKNILINIIELHILNKYGPFNLQFNNQQNFQTMKNILINIIELHILSSLSPSPERII